MIDDPYRCPGCGSCKGYWRAGLGYEHQMACPKCGTVWQPMQLVEQMREAEEQRLELNTSRE